MTPAEQAARVADSCHCQMGPDPSPCDGWLQHRKCDSLRDAIAAAIAQARREEWEACANIAEREPYDWVPHSDCDIELERHGERIAAAIRQRASGAQR